MSATAKLFTHGRSQAMRLPKEYRFEGREVRITKVGDRVILEPLAPLAPMPWEDIDGLGDTPFMPQGREQPQMPDDRPSFKR
ncbi:MAG: AbrB/MazE/SpoVT family DNA-binding domain-containing protein [Hyphomicrobiales bacterium]|nr:AbrB/MazE/SpoVT family DNA-binding domain-containing protein [Hyphomicrobiales bacterium]MBV9741796.1 AbrB/MazE/SpoVT family DNA-binding domain-containing protein [Hyphomicrobiales bacterium]